MIIQPKHNGTCHLTGRRKLDYRPKCQLAIKFLLRSYNSPQGLEILNKLILMYFVDIGVNFVKFCCCKIGRFLERNGDKLKVE